ncbi:MAG TPA: hypothetical protein VJO35_01610 [Terriglobales bacterium]|nr:hypothetical protein [Terriglobales bacterium]
MPVELSILVTSLGAMRFSEVCKTLVVNAHGCAIQTPVKFDTGIPLTFHSNDGRQATAKVVSCQPLGADSRAWRLGAKLDRPENFWGLINCPEDWKRTAAQLSARSPQIVVGATLTSSKPHDAANQTFEAKLDLVAQRLEVPLKRMIAESLAPLEAQVRVLKDTVARREANPNRFEVSLSSIPPQLEQQLQARLRKDLGPQVLHESRLEYASLLEAAKSAVDQRTTEAHKAFLHRVTEELKAVEKRADDLSTRISATADESLRHGLEDFQQKLLAGGNSLKRLGEELLEFLRDNLNAAHNARQQELEKLRASVVAESARLLRDTESLEGRIAKLNESARFLESGLDKRLSQLAGNVVKETRNQLESMSAESLEQLAANGAKTVESQLSDASEKITATQRSMTTSFHESLQAHASEALQIFEHSIEDLAQVSVERWRLKLAASLKTVAKNLGEQFELQVPTEDRTEPSQHLPE